MTERTARGWAVEGPTVTVNGTSRRLVAGAHTSLLDWLRGQGLTGAKEGCAEGECGACAVLVTRPDGSGGTRWTAVNSCLPSALALDGQEIVTSEGLGRPPGVGASGDLHAVQRALADGGGSQCGYCTPGFVCAMAAEYYRPDRGGSPEDVDLEAIGGNLCRCTGYRPIVDAARSLGTPPADDPLARRATRPPPPPASTRADGFRRPATYDELLAVLADHPHARVVAGATDLGVERNLRHARPGLLVAIDHLVELRTVEVAEDHVDIGAALSLSEVERTVGPRVPLLAALLARFASRLIRNAATLGGNLATGSPVGDAAPVLLALDAGVVLDSTAGEREIAVADLFTGYRATAARPGEIIRAVRVPLPPARHTTFVKIAKRRTDDIASVSVAAALAVTDDAISAARIGLGGVGPTPLRARRTEAALEGRPFTRDVLLAAAEVLATEGTPIDDVRASARYRSAMLGRALLRLAEEPGR